jgi:tight adherence protein B
MIASAVLFLLIFTGCLTIGTVGLMLTDRSRRIRRARLVRYSADHPGATSELVRKRVSQTTNTVAQAALKQRQAGIQGLLQRRVREAGLTMSPLSSLLVMGLIAALTCVGLAMATPLSKPLVGLISFGSGWIVLNAVFDVLKARRIGRFTEALPDCLDVFARGLRAGQPLSEALGLVASHASGIAQEEFLRCRDEHRVGRPLDETLASMADRIATPEARFIAVATNLQAETGGNLVETLENLAVLLRDRRKLRKKAAALSAETRVSAVILSSLPFGIGLIIFMFNPGYLAPLIQDPRGLLLTTVGVLSLCLGIFSMYKLSRIDV